MLFRSELRRSSMTPLLLVAAFVSAAGQAPSSAVAALQPVAQADRIAAHPDFAPLTQLSQQLPGWVQGASQSSAHSIDLSTNLRITLILRRDDAVQAAFTQLLADQQDRSSPLYHQWLTPQQIGKLYGPTPNDLATLTSWLTSQGLKIENISPSNVMVAVSGTVALVGNAFHTSFANFDPPSVVGENKSRTLRSALSEPTIPTALSPLVRSIHGLAEIPLHPPIHIKPAGGSTSADPSVLHPRYTDDGYHYLTPNDLAVIYDIASVYAGGDTGATIGSKAQHVAVVGQSRVEPADISAFQTEMHLPSSAVNVIIPTGVVDPGYTNDDWQREATLDVQRVVGTAPGATVDLVIAGYLGTSDGDYTAMQYNVDTLLDPVMSASVQFCELEAGVSDVDFVDTLASNGVAEGITTLVASGDAGAAGCEPFGMPLMAGTTNLPSINSVCSTTYVTCVGGTEFNDTANPSTYWSSTNGTGDESALSYIPEGAWNESGGVVDPTTGVTSYVILSTEGGVSLYIAKPTWQTGTGVPSGSFRFVPDVSYPAAEHDAYFGVYAGNFEGFAGTSASAPEMAAVVALINTYTGSASGNLNPLLYSLAASHPEAFHDVTVASSGVTDCTTSIPSMCNNSTPGPGSLTGGLAGFALTAGYDEATGLGSIDVANLLSAISSGGGGSGTGSFTLASSPSALTVAAGATYSNTSTITATSFSGFAGTIALTCKIVFNGSGTVNDPPACSLSPGTLTLTSGATATSTLSISSTAQTSRPCITQNAPIPTPWQRDSGIVLAGLLLLLLPLRKRRALRALAMACLLTAGIASMSGCGGASTPVIPCTPITVPGTTSGSYTVTITGTHGTSTATTTVALTIN
jgi:pseudomonalisin